MKVGTVVYIGFLIFLIILAFVMPGGISRGDRETKCNDGEVLGLVGGKWDCLNITTASTTFYPYTLNVTRGTYNSGNVSAISSYDNIILNVTEATGQNPLTVRVNFTNVTSMDYILMRERYGSASGSDHQIQLYLYDYNASSWEPYFSISSQSDFNVNIIPIGDADEHIFNKTVQVLFNHTSTPGNANHFFYLDFIQLIKGTTATITNEHDALSGRNNESNHPWAASIAFVLSAINTINAYNNGSFIRNNHHANYTAQLISLNVSVPASVFLPPTSGTSRFNTSGNWYFFVDATHDVRVYSFRYINGVKTYSSTYFQMPEVVIPADYDDTFGFFNWSWSVVAGADGYRLLRSEDNATYTRFRDVTGTTFIDRNEESWVYDTTVTPNLYYNTSIILFGNISEIFSGLTIWGMTTFKQGVNILGTVMLSGVPALSINEGYRRTLFGFNAGANLTTGEDITLIGHRAGLSLNVSNEITAVGSNTLNAMTSGSTGVAIGDSAGFGTISASNFIYLGSTANGYDSNNLVLGNDAVINNGITPTIVLSHGGVGSVANALIAGSGSYPMNNIYFGKGVQGTTSSARIQTSGGSGTNNAGGDTYIAGGKGTGNAQPGSVILEVSSPVASGSSLQTLSTRARLNNSGLHMSTPIDMGFQALYFNFSRAAYIQYDFLTNNLIVNSNNTGNGIVYVSSNLSAANLIDRSWYWDESLGWSLNYVKDGSELHTNGKPDDSKLNTFEQARFMVPDYTKPVTVEYTEEVCTNPKEVYCSVVLNCTFSPSATSAGKFIKTCKNETQCITRSKQDCNTVCRMVPDGVLNSNEYVQECAPACVEKVECKNETKTRQSYAPKVEIGRSVSATVGKHEQNIYDLKTVVERIKLCAADSATYEIYRQCVGGVVI